MTTDDQINESKLLFLLKFNLQDTIVYNEFTLFISQLSPVQIPTASAAHLTDLIFFNPLALTFLLKHDKPNHLK